MCRGAGPRAAQVVLTARAGAAGPALAGTRPAALRASPADTTENLGKPHVSEHSAEVRVLRDGASSFKVPHGFRNGAGCSSDHVFRCHEDLKMNRW